MDLKVKVEKKDLTEREGKIVEVLLLNMAAFANAQVTGEGMALNPQSLSTNEIWNHRLGWAKPITKKQGEDLSVNIKNRITNALKMSQIDFRTIDIRLNQHR